ncbi:hypothetical protein PM3016_6579 [Paenibacillus mucilaginosus 3016]|uniref:Uncharacterized protein n=1 Tax=Paenibacillus mucilaginosus 3016 TaxID=1116391 RepID=H6NKR5_9BACL|nr:hypothetical protein [Paenibacillus mucilaginosus]AFC33202.1 hypothetical protein PM3016_6579 [Paenibacillus mucilaginosus 3016]
MTLTSETGQHHRFCRAVSQTLISPVAVAAPSSSDEEVAAANPAAPKIRRTHSHVRFISILSFLYYQSDFIIE